ncbi:MAG: adenylyl-sulfate kinase [Candidatus Bathyarchaeota archaeon]|nr:adenylyl-sulfate kinase [Candidatus Bathyarchaeota archaeon]
MKVLICGKDGSGKSTIASLSAKRLQTKGYRILVVDADKSNYGLSVALRFITSLDAASKVCGVEQKEPVLAGRPTMAYPQYVTLPVIGPQFGGGSELIAAQNPDVVFITGTVPSALDALQSQLGIPVVGIVYGGLDTQDSIQIFYDSFYSNGQSAAQGKYRAASVIDYASGLMADLQTRTSNIHDSERHGIVLKHGLLTSAWMDARKLCLESVF